MRTAFYNGVSGLVAYQNQMDLLSNNIANVNSYGFKGSRAAFSDLLYTEMYVNTDERARDGQTAEAAGENPATIDSDGIHLVGHGIKMFDSDLVMRQGSPLPTQNPLDFALVGEGFFAVQRPDGSIQYTRDGTFDIGLQGRNGYLVASSDGSFILDGKGKQIKLKRDPETKLFDLTQLKDTIGVYTFSNPYGLEPAGGTRFRQTDKSGEAQSANNAKEHPYTLIQHSVEQSSVDLAEEMTNVIIAQKAFQFSAKMVQTADQVEEIINNLR